jgi:hypothetical protein
VAAGGTFVVSYPSGYTQSSFTGDDATTSVMGAQHNDLPVTLGGSSATITWPAGKATTLPAGTELTIGLNLVGSVESADLQNLLPNQAASTNLSGLTDNTGGTPAAQLVDVGAAFSQANLNNNFASLYAKVAALETENNALLTKLKNAGLMVAD